MSDYVTRGEHEDVLRRLTVAEDVEKEALKVLHDIDKRTELIQKDIAGNGVIGILQRLINLESWMKVHPRNCPVSKTRKEILAIRSLEVAIVSLVFTGLTVVLKLVHVL